MYLKFFPFKTKTFQLQERGKPTKTPVQNELPAAASLEPADVMSVTDKGQPRVMSEKDLFPDEPDDASLNVSQYMYTFICSCIYS